MNFFKRGLLNVVRKKGKTLILLAVILILGNVISGAISIQQATNNVEETIKERLGTEATIELDHEAIMEMDESERMSFEITNLELDLIHQVGELAYVKHYDYNITTSLGSDSIESYQGEMDDDIVVHGPRMDFRLKGINYAPVLDFEEEESQLVDGRVFTDEEVENGSSVAIISQKLAEQNDLQIGDTFALTNSVYDYSSMENPEEEPEAVATRDLALEIIGFFEPVSVEIDEEDGGMHDGGMIDWMNMDLQNTIYVSNEVVSDELRFNFEQTMEINEEQFAAEGMERPEYTEHFTPVFMLNGPDDSEPFREEVMPMLPDLYTVLQAGDQYDNIAGPVQSMSTLSGYVLIVSIIATILIIGLVVLLFLRDRKRELGIYLSLGERRGRVVGQVLIEVLIIAAVGITLSLFTGNLLAQGVSDTMIEANMDDNQMQQDMMYNPGMHSDITTDDVVESFEVQIDGGYIGMFYGVGLLTVLLSTAIPLIYIVRLNPRKIMM